MRAVGAVRVERLVDRDLARVGQRRLDQLSDHGAIGPGRELDDDVVVDRLELGPADPATAQRLRQFGRHGLAGRLILGVDHVGGHLRRRLRALALVARRVRVVGNDRVPFVTRVFPPFVGRVVAHRVAHRERAGEHDRVLCLDLVEEHVVVQARDPFGRLHLIALREPVPRG
ncbi:hypothetical protein D3C83_14060 [compost metagenome]